jgi:uncharacterized protein (TIGR03435 family)
LSESNVDDQIDSLADMQYLEPTAAAIGWARYRRGADNGSGAGFLGQRIALSVCVSVAFDLRASRSNYSAGSPDVYLDVLVKCCSSLTNAFQELLRKQFTIEITEQNTAVDCWILRSEGNAIVKPAPSYAGYRVDRDGFHSEGEAFSNFARAVEDIFGQPCFDETSLQGPHKISVEWKAVMDSTAAERAQRLKQLLERQLGLSLVQTRREVSITSVRVSPRIDPQ